MMLLPRAYAITFFAASAQVRRLPAIPNTFEEVLGTTTSFSLANRSLPGISSLRLVTVPVEL